MRFKASIVNIHTFTRLTASLSSLGKDVWLQLNNEQLRFTVVPEQGSQVWAVLSIDTIFDPYNIHSAAENNAINLRVPLASLHRALRSAASASSASIRLTKKDDIPMLSLTIITSNLASRHPTALVSASLNQEMDGPRDEYGNDGNSAPGAGPDASMAPPGVAYDRETTITQDVPVIVLAPVTVALIHQPHCPEPDVHIILPPLLQLKSISERFTKLALSTSTSSGGATTSRPSTQRQRMASTLTGDSFGTSSSRLLISANMHGVLKLGLETSQLRIESQWTGLTNPDLDPTQVEGGEAGIQDHASTRMKQRYGDDAWSRVRVEGKDWGRVLGVGRMGGRVIACFCHEHALILYVYLSDDAAAESVLTNAPRPTYCDDLDGPMRARLINMPINEREFLQKRRW